MVYRRYYDEKILSIGKILARDIFELKDEHKGKQIYYENKDFPGVTEKIIGIKEI